MLHVTVTSPERVVFDGSAQHAIFPGEQGTFEVLPLHRAMISRLGEGMVEIDGKFLRIRRGIVRVADNEVTAVVEIK